jgi:hypothetical protein
MDRIEKINLVRCIMVVGFVCAVFFHYICGVYLGYGYPYSTFLYAPEQRFIDFIVSHTAATGLNPYSDMFSAYFPFTYVFLYAFTPLASAVAYSILVAGGLALLSVAIWKHLPDTGVTDRIFTVFILVVMSYPVLFTFDRGNIEFIVCAFLGCFVVFYSKGRDTAATVFLASAIAMKAFPVVFAILFVLDRKWRQLFLTAFYVILLTLLSSALFKGGISATISGLQNSLVFYKQNCLDSFAGLQHNSSMYIPFHLTLYSPITGQDISKYYPFLAIPVFICSYVYLELVENEYWKKIAILTFIIILLPKVSFDYKLLYIYLPLLLFLKERNHSKYDGIYALLFGLLLIPKDYYYFNPYINFNGIANPCLMLLFIVILMCDKGPKTAAGASCTC